VGCILNGGFLLISAKHRTGQFGGRGTKVLGEKEGEGGGGEKEVCLTTYNAMVENILRGLVGKEKRKENSGLNRVHMESGEPATKLDNQPPLVRILTLLPSSKYPKASGRGKNWGKKEGKGKKGQTRKKTRGEEDSQIET